MATTLQIVKAWNSFSQALEEAREYIPQYAQLLARDYKRAYKEINTTASMLDAKLAKIKSEGSKLASKMQDYPAVSSSVDKIKKFTVILVPFELTKLSRFMDFWKGSGKKLLEKSIEFRDEMQVQASNIEMSKEGSGYDDVVKNSNNQARQIVNAMAASLSSSGGVDYESAFSSLQESAVSERALMPLVTLLKAARDTEARLYADIDTEALDQKIELESSYYNAIDSLTSGDYLNMTDEQKASVLNVLTTVQNAVGTQVQIFKKGTGTAGKKAVLFGTVDLSNLEKTARTLQKSSGDLEIRAGGQGSQTIGMAAQAAGVFASQSEREARTLKRSETDTKRNAEYVKGLLESVRVVMKNDDGSEEIRSVFSEQERNIISQLFFAGYVRIPKFGDFQKDVYNPLDTADGQTVSLVRLRMGELISGIIVNKLQQYDDDAEFTYDAVDYLRGSKQVSVKGRAGFAPGQQRSTMSEAATELIYGIARDAFPTDFTAVMAARQQAKVVLPDAEGNKTLVAMNHKSFYASPNLSIVGVSDKQGDHVKGYNNVGATVGRNLIALPSATNQQKQDAETARDQLLMAVQVYNDTFGAIHTEDKWIQDALKFTGMNQIQNMGEELAEQAEKAFSQYKNADGTYKGVEQEIDEFARDEREYNSMKSTAKQDLQKLATWMQSCFNLYENVQSSFADLQSQIGEFEKQTKKDFGLAGTDSGNQVAKLYKKAVKAVEEMQKQLAILDGDIKAVDKLAHEKVPISTAERQQTILPFLGELRSNFGKTYSTKTKIKTNTDLGKFKDNYDTFIIELNPAITLQKSKRPNLRSTQKMNGKMVIKSFNYLPANKPEIDSIEIVFDMDQIESIINKNRENMRKRTNKQSSINKDVAAFESTYQDMLNNAENIELDMKEQDADRVRYIEKLRGFLTVIVQEQTKILEQIRTRDLEAIEQRIIDTGLVRFASIFHDLKRGEQSWRQARSIEKVNTIISNAQANTGFDFIDQNIKDYEEGVKELKKSDGPIDQFIKILDGKNGKSFSAKDATEKLMLFSNTMVDLIEANKFVLFSEYFE